MAVQVSKTLKSVGATVEMLRLRFAIVGRGMKAPKKYTSSITDVSILVFIYTDKD